MYRESPTQPSHHSLVHTYIHTYVPKYEPMRGAARYFLLPQESVSLVLGSDRHDLIGVRIHEGGKDLLVWISHAWLVG